MSPLPTVISAATPHHLQQLTKIPTHRNHKQGAPRVRFPDGAAWRFHPLALQSLEPPRPSGSGTSTSTTAARSSLGGKAGVPATSAAAKTTALARFKPGTRVRIKDVRKWRCRVGSGRV